MCVGRALRSGRLVVDTRTGEISHLDRPSQSGRCAASAELVSGCGEGETRPVRDMCSSSCSPLKACSVFNTGVSVSSRNQTISLNHPRARRESIYGLKCEGSRRRAFLGAMSLIHRVELVWLLWLSFRASIPLDMVTRSSTAETSEMILSGAVYRPRRPTRAGTPRWTSRALA